ncbi:unnamed protein product [Closterium sp. NIES-64]|nr:unnamed protein product [Closterium sp. NIES-64]
MCGFSTFSIPTPQRAGPHFAFSGCLARPSRAIPTPPFTHDPGVYHMSIFLASHVSRPYLPPPNRCEVRAVKGVSKRLCMPFQASTPRLLPCAPHASTHIVPFPPTLPASGRGAGSEGREQAVVPAACLSGSGHSHRHWRAAGLLAVEASVVFAWSACMHMVSPSQLHACTRAHGTGTFHSHCHCWHGQCMNGSRVVHGRCKACMMHHARIASHMQLLFTSPHRVVEGTDPAEVTFESIQKPLGCRTTFHLSPHQVVEGTDPAEVTFESIQKPLGCRTTFHLSPHQVVEGTDPAEVTFESIQKPLGCRTTFHLSPHQVVEGTDPAEVTFESIQKPLGCRTTFHLSPHQVVEGTDPAEVTFESIQKPLGCRTTFHLSPHQVVEGTDPAEVTFESIQKPLGCRTTFHLSPHQVVEGTDPAEVTFESIQKPLGCRTTFHLSPHQVVEGTDPAEVTFESIQKPLGCRTTFHLSPHQVVEGTDPAEVTFESIQKPLGCKTTFHLSPHQVVEGTDPAELRDELKEALPRAPKQQLVGARLHDEGLVGALMNAQ